MIIIYHNINSTPSWKLAHELTHLTYILVMPGSNLSWPFITMADDFCSFPQSTRKIDDSNSNNTTTTFFHSLFSSLFTNSDFTIHLLTYSWS